MNTPKTPSIQLFVWDQSKPQTLTLGTTFSDGQNDHICDIDCSGSNSAERRAFAKMFATAPKMLETLKTIHSLLEWIDGTLVTGSDVKIAVNSTMDAFNRKMLAQVEGVLSEIQETVQPTPKVHVVRLYQGNLSAYAYNADTEEELAEIYVETHGQEWVVQGPHGKVYGRVSHRSEIVPFIQKLFNSDRVLEEIEE